MTKDNFLDKLAHLIRWSPAVAGILLLIWLGVLLWPASAFLIVSLLFGFVVLAFILFYLGLLDWAERRLKK